MTNENELYHHGILGMKWGERNGPPYPLGSGAHSAREKRLGTKGWTAEAKAEAKKKSSGKEDVVSKKKTRKTAEDISQEVKSKSKGQNGEAPSSSNSDSFSDYEKKYQKELKNAEAAKKYQEKATEYGKKHADLVKNGLQSKTFKETYKGADLNGALFFMCHGKTKKQALDDLTRECEALQKKNEKAAKDKAEGRLTDGQKLAIAAGLAVGVVAAYGVYQYKTNAKSIRFTKDYIKRVTAFANNPIAIADRLPDIDYTIPAGDVLKRLCGESENFIKDSFYACWKEKDVTRYLAVYAGDGNMTQRHGKNIYTNTIKAINDLKIPSQRKMLQEYLNLIQSDSDFKSRVADKYVGMGLFGNLAKNDPNGLARDTFFSFIGNIAVPENGQAELTDRFFKALRAKGYSGIIDTNDAGKLGDLPLIIFDGKENAELVGRTKVTKRAINKAKRAIELLDGG